MDFEFQDVSLFVYMVDTWETTGTLVRACAPYPLLSDPRNQRRWRLTFYVRWPGDLCHSGSIRGESNDRSFCSLPISFSSQSAVAWVTAGVRNSSALAWHGSTFTCFTSGPHTASLSPGASFSMERPYSSKLEANGRLWIERRHPFYKTR